MDPVHGRGSMDPVHESGPWTRSKVGVHGPLVHVLSSPVLSCLDCGSTAARHQHDLVSDVEINSVEYNGGCQKQNTKTKKRFSKLLNVF